MKKFYLFFLCLPLSGVWGAPKVDPTFSEDLPVDMQPFYLKHYDPQRRMPYYKKDPRGERVIEHGWIYNTTEDDDGYEGSSAGRSSIRPMPVQDIDIKEVRSYFSLLTSVLSTPLSFAASLFTGVHSDRRTRVLETESFPWCVCGQLSMSFLDDSGSVTHIYLGSGALVGPRHVLTAAHNLWMPELQKDSSGPRYITFHPGRNEERDPWRSRGEKYVIHSDFIKQNTDEEKQASNLALIKIDKPLGERFGFLDLSFVQPGDLTTINITGYPGEKNGQMYTMAGELKGVNGGQLFYDVDTSAGQSGSPVWIQKDHKYICIGIHTMGRKTDRFNSGTYLTPEHLKTLQSWIKEI
ncbi:MAG: hypothetical protein B7Y25_04220 [Alphaproteobacteria bacterium 16-39-46]|nr:MAG: hypothetical protein B7Y25_04220 [Alphaproteobacteria bacterium 16-39-46]OZA43070.1 MAG: hypothetical protein B7X84_04185 [Alphaproteobacteria bacterium 17-39-52]HQS84112.1 trypsin-like peptidase domain-containing protein [Alphaproteobacteria bacterium]HQS93986.1 trypsin-like peptidase domain-containing protein [Alphaproteobacteria bacterium]